jgi:hypothetical protein
MIVPLCRLFSSVAEIGFGQLDLAGVEEGAAKDPQIARRALVRGGILYNPL